MRTITNEELALMDLLEKSTGAKATDAFTSDDFVFFVVQKGDLGKAIGRHGVNIEKMKKAFDKNIGVIEQATDLKGFVASLFAPVLVTAVNENTDGERKTVTVFVEQKDRGQAIGKGGEKIKKARVFLNRYYNITDVKLG